MKQLAEVPPSACNRLDRNTSGIVACGKSVKGLQGLAVLLRERQVEKHYRCIVYGRVSGSGVLTGYLKKDRKANQVSVSLREEEGSKEIVTAYRPLMSGIAPGHTEVTLLDVSPKTGRSHQIRAHLTFAGHPLLGDTKYTCADKAPAAPMGLKGQLLHCDFMRFGDSDVLPQLKDMSVTAPLPAHFSAIMDMIDWDTMEDGQ